MGEGGERYFFGGTEPRILALAVVNQFSYFPARLTETRFISVTPQVYRKWVEPCCSPVCTSSSVYGSYVAIND